MALFLKPLFNISFILICFNLVKLIKRGFILIYLLTKKNIIMFIIKSKKTQKLFIAKSIRQAKNIVKQNTLKKFNVYGARKKYSLKNTNWEYYKLPNLTKKLTL